MEGAMEDIRHGGGKSYDSHNKQRGTRGDKYWKIDHISQRGHDQGATADSQKAGDEPQEKKGGHGQDKIIMVLERYAIHALKNPGNTAAGGGRSSMEGGLSDFGRKNMNKAKATRKTLKMPSKLLRAT